MASRVTWVLACVGGLLLTGCSSGGNGASPGGVTATDPPSTDAGATSPVASVATTAPLPPVSLPSEGMAGAIEIPGGPDWLAGDDLGVWVRSETGVVALVDPVTHAVVDTVEPEPGGAPCRGLGAGAGSIWSCVSSGVARIDPATRGGISIISSNKAAAQRELPVAEQQLWMLTGDGSILEGIHINDQQVWSRFALPVRGTDIDAGAAGLWVVSTVDNAVIRIDMNTGKVLARVNVQAPVDVAVDSEVWVGAAAETVRIDPSTATIDRSVAAGTGADGAIALTPGEVWIRNVEPFLTRGDRATGAVVQQYANADVTGGGDILYAFGSIWTTAAELATLFRFAAPA